MYNPNATREKLIVSCYNVYNSKTKAGKTMSYKHLSIVEREKILERVGKMNLKNQPKEIRSRVARFATPIPPVVG